MSVECLGHVLTQVSRRHEKEVYQDSQAKYQGQIPTLEDLGKAKYKNVENSLNLYFL